MSNLGNKTSLCTDAGYMSRNKHGEQLCGDHVEIIEKEDGTLILVLADGLGSGVRACILSTLTSRIISTMMAESMSLEECVETIAATLPVDPARDVAYSTFTIIRIAPGGGEAEIIQYDNPGVIMLRDGKLFEFDKTMSTIGGKKIFRSKIKTAEDDVFVAMSDGVEHAGIGGRYNFGWKRTDIAEWLEGLYNVGFTAKTISTILVDECVKLYGNEPGDDTTAATIRIRRREPMNFMMGPPANPDDLGKMHALFFSKEGGRIICGGTTSQLAAKYLGKEVVPVLDYSDPDIPPIATVEGVDLVTEGVVTVSRVLEYARDHLDENKLYSKWNTGRDGASRIARKLFEEATDINFFVGRAVNPAHQNPNLPINFNIKMQLIDELADCLKKMGKRIKVSYF